MCVACADDLLIESDLTQIYRIASFLGVDFIFAPGADVLHLNNSEFPTGLLSIASLLSHLASTLRLLRRSILLLQEIETLVRIFAVQFDYFCLQL